ncbi:MAG: squalene/phytoene synthase family protein [Rhizobiales bacterium]|nr:squalene/phytoene synthase family protein [Hyphomicrobiales bacterium]MBN9009721.1 squalene/phytoene synthase family protein [Hyphomicrobiales bacterium]
MDAYAHTADAVRAGDRDRYLADLFVPEAARHHFFALHAFNLEVARIRETGSEPNLGEIRLQWWRDALAGEGSGHPVAEALQKTIAGFRLPVTALANLIEARRFDLYDDAMPSLNDLEGYAGETSSSLMQLGAIILSDGADPGAAEVAGHAGVAWALTGLLRALPIHSARGQCYLPADLMAKHGVDRADLHAGKTSPGLERLLAELRARVRGHLTAVSHGIARVPGPIQAAFLPVALCEPYLRKMERRGFDPLKTVADISPLRRHWALWRAARQGFG